MINLNEYKNNIYSQHGEDGILKKIFEELGIGKGYFCEFGAWDGKYLSNAYSLYEAGWSGCYIESDKAKFADLKKHITRQDVDLVNAFITPNGENTLDHILGRVNHAGLKLELLSIDIDSDDLAIWRSMKSQHPSVVVIEYNPTIPIDIAYENPVGENKGNSALSLYTFGIAQGYDLVATTATNLIFVDRAVNSGRFCSFELNDPQLDLGYRYFFGYDGTLIQMSVHSQKAEYREVFTVPWNGSVFTQPVNRAFRIFGGSKFRRLVGFSFSVLSAIIRRPFSSTGPLVQFAFRKAKSNRASKQNTIETWNSPGRKISTNIHSPKSLKLTKEYFIQGILKYFNRIFHRDANMDDFDWQRYPYHYQAELAEIKKSYTQVLTSGDYVFSGGVLSLQKNILPLHSNARLLYETILQLSPSSILEVGCGGGDHLFNLSTLAPNIHLYGCDRSMEQLSFLHKRHPELKAAIEQLDITLPYSSKWPIVDLCFSQAVIMHIHTGDNHLVALSNLFKTAKKYVVLMENWKSHNFMESIRNIFDKKMIPWGDLFFYYRISPEPNKPRLMIVSSIKLNYEPITKYDILL